MHHWLCVTTTQEEGWVHPQAHTHTHKKKLSSTPLAPRIQERMQEEENATQPQERSCTSTLDFRSLVIPTTNDTTTTDGSSWDPHRVHFNEFRDDAITTMEDHHPDDDPNSVRLLDWTKLRTTEEEEEEEEEEEQEHASRSKNNNSNTNPTTTSHFTTSHVDQQQQHVVDPFGWPRLWGDDDNNHPEEKQAEDSNDDNNDTRAASTSEEGGLFISHADTLSLLSNHHQEHSHLPPSLFPSQQERIQSYLRAEDDDPEENSSSSRADTSSCSSEEDDDDDASELSPIPHQLQEEEEEDYGRISPCLDTTAATADISVVTQSMAQFRTTTTTDRDSATNVVAPAVTTADFQFEAQFEDVQEASTTTMEDLQIRSNVYRTKVPLLRPPPPQER